MALASGYVYYSATGISESETATVATAAATAADAAAAHGPKR